MENKKTTTIYDVAKAANVSVSTVSRVINHYDQVKRSTSEKVIQAMNELSFDMESVRSTSLSKSIKHTVKKDTALLFVISVPKLDNLFYADIIEGAQIAAQKNGHHLLINNTPIHSFHSDFYISLLKSHNIAGLILTETLSSEALTKVKNMFPVVQCSEYNEEFDMLSYVSIDDSKAAYDMTSYFISSGYKRIAYLTTPLEHQYAKRRKRGYSRALNEAGLAANPNWILELDDMNFDKSILQIKNILTANPPQCIVAVSDTLAAAAIKAAELLNLRVPQDIAITGMDDVPIAKSTTPTISTVAQPRYQLGYTAFELLLNETLKPHVKKQHIFLDTTFIHRESTKRNA